MGGREIKNNGGGITSSLVQFLSFASLQIYMVRILSNQRLHISKENYNI